MNEGLEIYRTEAFPDGESPEEPRSKSWRFVVDILETLILSLILFLGINAVSARIRVDGNSMQPTLQSGEFVVVNKLAYKLGDVSRGDVVVFHPPRSPDQEYIKRVVGLPGDEVSIQGGRVLVNGVELEESYINAPPTYGGQWTVSEDGLFVLGDNRNNSSDSHNWGEVPLEMVIGKAVFIYWPPPDWGAIDRPFIARAAP
ncbi:MAG: signal peptidase I [Anaerolineales bacterium]|nr:signal peptidase I [Anaerolineales bacterium]